MSPITTEAIAGGLAAHPVEDIRWARCDIKSTNLLAAVLAKQEAKDAGCQEALFVGPAGVVREGGSSNVFVVMSGEVWTHPAGTRILSGVTRLRVLELAAARGITVVQREFTLTNLEQADECFLTSTTRDVMPVVRVGGRSVGDGRPGPVTLALVDAMRGEIARLAGASAPPLLGRGLG